MICRKFVLSLIFLIFPLFAFAYEKVPVTINFKGGGELYTFFYCFNEHSDGKKAAEELFNFKHYDNLAASKRKKMMPVPIGTNVGYYTYAIFCYGYEFWLFENKNGYLWGVGAMLDYPLGFSN
ncbi:hypothetical protein [uncultured Treponema sp.]|uniref:hypothetical protein n=1 Tax=uncultured Treponema sp. TaxID=162155 RepID=UPI0025EE2AC9|nr:hypothetical protein [uncultured Treponema sp.]